MKNMNSNAPRTLELIYKIEITDRILIENFGEKTIDYPKFSLLFKNSEMHVILKYPAVSTQDIEYEINNLIDNWHSFYDLKYGYEVIRFYIDGKVYEELDPNNKFGSCYVRAKVTMSVSAKATTPLNEFPLPLTSYSTNDRLNLAIHRYQRVLDGKEPILAYGYYLLNSLEEEFGASKHKTDDKRLAISSELKIEFSILQQLGGWTSEKGDEKTARKVKGNPLTGLNQSEEAWIHRCIKCLLTRYGEYLFDKSNLKMIYQNDI